MTAGILTPDGDWLTWARQYVEYLQEVAGGRRGDGDLDLVQETARLKKLQADRVLIDIKNLLGEVVHVESIAHTLSAAFAIARTHLLALPIKLKSIISKLDARDVKTIDDEVRRVLTDLSTTHFPEPVKAKIDEIERAGWGDIGETNGKILDQGRGGTVDSGPRSDAPPSSGSDAEDGRALSASKRRRPQHSRAARTRDFDRNSKD